MQNLKSRMDDVMLRRGALSDAGYPRQSGLNAVSRELDHSADAAREAPGGDAREPSGGSYGSDYSDHSRLAPAPSLSETTCPYCRETIREGAIICRHCRSALGPNSPALRSDNGSQQASPAGDSRSAGASNAFQRFVEAQRTCWLRKYANARGRASRSEFWYFSLAVAAVNIVLAAVIADETASNVARGLFGLASFAPQITVGVRRLQDTNRSGVWYLLILTGIGVIPLIYWWVKAGDKDVNRFGAPPA